MDFSNVESDDASIPDVPGAMCEDVQVETEVEAEVEAKVEAKVEAMVAKRDKSSRRKFFLERPSPSPTDA